jgi:mono/diheme cytochrome c family protein
MRALIASVAFNIVGVVTTVQAQDFGDIRQGRRLALDMCASCHAVRASEILSPDLAAPSFRAVAHTPGMNIACGRRCANVSIPESDFIAPDKVRCA